MINETCFKNANRLNFDSLLSDLVNCLNHSYFTYDELLHWKVYQEFEVYRVNIEYQNLQPLWLYKRETDSISRVVVDELVFESTGDPDDHNGQIRIKDHFSVLLYIRFVSYVKAMAAIGFVVFAIPIYNNRFNSQGQ